MSTNIIPFESMNAFPIQFDAGAFDLNAAAEEFASAKFPVISIKSNRFHVKRDGENETIPRIKSKPSDPDEPASYIDMVVLNLQKGKNLYLNGYEEGSTEKPDCFSNDGITPDISIEEPQCSTCALCEHNVWGTGIDATGKPTRGKRCKDNLRTAIASPADLDSQFLLRIPAGSLGNFSETSRWLSNKHAPVNSAVIRIAFDPTKTGILTFQAIGGLDADTYAKARALKDSALVRSIVGKSGFATMSQAEFNAAKLEAPKAEKLKAPAKPAVDPEVEAKKAKAAEKAKKIAAAKAALEAASAEDDDDEVEAVAPTTGPAKAAKSATKVVTSGALEDELAALLS